VRGTAPAVLRVDHDRYRAVVRQFDLHSRAEDSGLDVDAEAAKLDTEALVQGLRCFGPRRVRERRSIASRRVGDERELADDERAAARVEKRPVELAALVPEDPQPGDLAGEPFGVGFRVAVGDAEQDEQTGVDRSTGCRARPRDALDDRSQLRSLIRDS
jgi:hypothetical protein